MFHRKLFFAAVLAVLVPLSAAAIGIRPWTETQLLTAAVPTLATQGIGLTPSQNGGKGWVRGFHFTIQPPAGQSLTGGTVEIYYWNGVQWAHNPTLDYTVIPDPSGAAQQTPQFEVVAPAGRIYPRCNGVTLSGAGTTVGIRLEIVVD